ncbi:MAG: AAA family ATPase [Deltaproteobacteria bacterium]|nr:AAA family ATPase [Deltaproteobacteria bacterium]
MEQTLAGHYRTTALLKSGRGVETFRGVDLDRGEPVVIKKTSSAAVSSSTQLRLEHEADVLRDLWGHASGLAPPIDVGRERGEFFLIAPFVPGVTLAERLQRGPLGAAHTVEIARGLMRALREVHERGVIHRDVKPANIVLGPGARPTVTLIDFGLARSAQLDTWTREEPAGTIAYISPEQAGLIKRDVGERADLYSAGIVLFECLSGHPPFRADTAGEVLRQQLTVPPPELRSLGVAVPRALDEVIQRLLRKDPRDRYQSAAAVLVDLDAIAHALESGQRDPALVIGARDVRHTLTEPAFVGREKELRALVAEVDRARGGEPRLVFVEAESGAGKSRLVAEVAVHAAQSGAWLLRGQATSQGVQRPLQLFEGVAQDVVARSREEPDLADELRRRLGDQRVAVCAALPMLADVLAPEGPIAVGSEAHGEARTVPALVALLDALGSRESLTVIVLDDCQSADELSLKVVAAWQKEKAHASPHAGAHLLVVAIYRSDEVAVAHLLRHLTPSLRIELSPLGPDEVRHLAESMAGALPDSAVRLVERLSQGNPFVAAAALEGLVETGALVDTAHGFEVDPDAMALAQSSGRGASFLARRLERLPRSVLELLSACAILGKTFELPLAADLTGRPIGEAMNDLLEARRRHLVWIEPLSDRFSFAHDRVRARLLERLSPDERRRLHGLAARRLELEKHGSHPDLAFDLAYHFDEAGDPASALTYALEAASRARARHALEIAERQYRIAMRGLDGASGDDRRAIVEALGDVLMLRGRYDEAAIELENARGLATSALASAQIQGKLGELAFKRGRVPDAASALEHALVELGWRLPRGSFSMLLATLLQTLLQVLHTLFPRFFLGRGAPERREIDLLGARLFSRLAYAYWFQRGQVATFWAHLSNLNLAEKHPETPELAQACSEHALGMTGLPRIFFRRGRRYADRGLAIRRELGDVPGEAQSLSFHGMLLYAAGEYPAALERFREASRVLRRIGDRWEANIAGVQIAFCHYRMGALREALDECRRVHRDGVDIGDAHATALVLEVWSKVTGGAVPAELVGAALETSRNDAQTRESVLQAEALRRLREGDPRRAVEAIAEAERVVRRAELKSEYVSYLPLWRGHLLRVAAEQVDGTVVIPGPKRLVAAERAVDRGLRIARRYRGNYPMALREKALLLARRGACRRAQRLVERSLAEAETLGTRFEYAQSLLVRGEIRRLRGMPGAEAETAHARALLHELGADFVLRRRSGNGEPPPVSLSLADRFACVVDSGRRIAAALDPEQIHQATCNAAASLLRGQSSSVLVIEGDELRALATTGRSDGTIFSRGLAMRAFAQHRPVVWTEATRDGATESTELAGMRSVLCAPIVVGAKPTYCLYVTHDLVGALFGEDEQRLAEYIVALAGAALERAEAFAQLRALSLSLEQRVKDRTAELGTANEELDANLRRLREAQEQLIQTGKMAAVGTLVAGLSHEINNPVAVILAQAQSLLRRVPAGDPLRRPMEAIGRQAARCAALVRTMLDFTRKSTGARVDTAIQSLMTEVADLARAKAREADVALEQVDLQPDLSVKVSRTEIESALLNLVDNAIDASSRGGVVRIGAERVEREGRAGICFYVSDRGPGIPPEQLPRIFDPFYTTKPAGRGTGLGLSLALQIVEAHCGRLTVESRLGEGTTMRLWLPEGDRS